MAALLEYVLNGEVSPFELVEWLRCGNCDSKNECLKKHEKLRQEFLAFFLNNLREQCSWLIQGSRRPCLTPGKVCCISTSDSLCVSNVNEEKGRRAKFPITSSPNDLTNSQCISKYRRELKYKISSCSSDHSIVLSIETSHSDGIHGEKCNSPVLTIKGGCAKDDEHKINDIQNISATSSVHHKFEPKLEITKNQIKTKRSPLSANRGNVSYQLHKKCNDISAEKNIPKRNRKKRGGKLSKDSNEGETSALKIPIPVPDINDFDAFPPVGIPTVVVKPSRRITPTAVVKDTRNSITVSPISTLLSENSFSTPRKAWNNVFQSTPLKESGDSSLQEERELLKKTRNRLLNSSTKSSISGYSVSPEIQLDDLDNNQQQSSLVGTPGKQNESSLEWDVPNLSCINFKDKLDIMVNIFGRCIETSLVPNISVELYFVFQLLTSRVKIGEAKKNSDLEGIFSSIHNCVYFATCVLKHQKRLLELLDRSTLKLLLEVPYLKIFSSELVEIITALYDKITVVPKRKLSCIEGVSFQADTDNSKNFTSSNSFHIFRKQRDLFYELFRDWKKHQLVPGWTTKESFMKRVKNLVSLGINPTNYAHLARLIQSQLITSCCGTEDLNDSTDEKALADLKRSFPEKFEKLQERFLTPTQTRGSCPPCSFLGSQSFFHDFLQVAESASLNQHLTDNLAAKIIEFNKIEIACDSDICIDNQLQEQFLNTLHTLRLLAKFLGYISFFPYQTSETIPAEMMASQSTLRNHVLPSLDIYSLLQEALIKHRLVLTVPWIVEFLSMMDPVAPFLDYYQNVFVLIFKIYKVKDLHHMNSINFMFIKLMLGWLFETPHFPHSLFFLDVTKNCGNDLQDEHSVSSDLLDSLAVVDHNVIYLCCPYLGDLRILLEDYLTGIRSKGGEVRKITPVSADDSSSSSIAAKQLELQLEENFFHLHPSSLKRTVEFVADRIASRAIRLIRNNLVPCSKQNIVKELKLVVKAHPNLSNIGKKVQELEPTITEFAVKLHHDIKTEASIFLQTFCFQETEKALPLLMSEETDPQVVKMCNKISCRIATDTVLHWIKTHVTMAFTQCDIQAEVEKILKNKGDTSVGGLNKKENLKDMQEETKHSAFQCMSMMRNCILEVEAEKNPAKYVAEEILNIIVNIENFLKSGQQLPSTIKTVSVLLVDFIVILIVHLPKNCTDEVFSAVIQLCSEFFQPSVMCNIISSRNIQLLSLSQEPNESWLKISTLTTRLLECNLLTLNDVENNIMIIVKQDWSEDTLCHFASCLQHVIGSCKKELESLNVTDWLTWYGQQPKGGNQ